VRVWAVAVLIGLGLPVWAAGIEVRDDLGHTSRLAAPPKRVVSLLPSLTESVCGLGACDRLVGVDRNSNFPPQVKTLPEVGGIDDTHVEQIVTLKPDLVLAATSTRVTDRLRALGLTVVALEPRSHADAQRVLGLLGQVLGVADAGLLWQRIETATAAAAASVPAQACGVRVYWEVSSGLYAASPASFMGELLTRLGAANIVPASLGPFPKLNPEFVVQQNPALILVGARSAAGLAQRPGWSQIDAVRKGRICTFSNEEGDILARPGPRLAEAAQIVARCLAEKLGK
jgi:iron complex transport system substrate-binding protein